MNNNKELEILFHAYSLENYFSSTIISTLFQCYVNGQAEETAYDDNNFSRQRLLSLIGVPSDRSWLKAREEIYQALDIGIKVVSFLDKDYPQNLLNISDPPLVLFILSKEELSVESWNPLATWGIVGARNASSYGLMMSRDLSSELTSADCTVVSGLAYGIDKSAHEGSLIGAKKRGSNFCPTIAVLGSGLLEIYPTSHCGLVQEIVDSGGFIISEYGLRMMPKALLFPRRNRIISGLSTGLIVVEAKKRSGSLITARLALEQDRDLYCVPGPIDSALSEGVNLLIKDGAGVITSIKDFVDIVVLKDKKVSRRPQSKVTPLVSRKLNVIQEKLLSLMKKNDQTLDDLIVSEIADEEVLRHELLRLEIDGLVIQDGVYFSLKR